MLESSWLGARKRPGPDAGGGAVAAAVAEFVCEVAAVVASCVPGDVGNGLGAVAGSVAGGGSLVKNLRNAGRRRLQVCAWWQRGRGCFCPSCCCCRLCR